MIIETSSLSAGPIPRLLFFSMTGMANSSSAILFVFVGDLNSFAIGDLDHNKYLDLLVAYEYPYGIGIFLNDGNSIFHEPTAHLDSSLKFDQMEIEDMNNDGERDVVVIDGYTAMIGIYFNHGDNTFTGLNTYPTSGTPKRFVLKDINDDEQLDMIIRLHNGVSIYYTDCPTLSS